MKNTVIFFKRFLGYSALPMLFASAFLAVIYAAFGRSVDGALEASFAFLLPLCAVYYSHKSFKKAIAAGLCSFLSSFIFSSFSGFNFSLIISVLFAFAGYKLFNSVKLLYGFMVMLLLSTTVGFALGLGYDYLYSLMKAFAVNLKGRGALFGTVNSFYELFVSKSLEKLFYKTSYSVSVVGENSIVSGIMNVFKGRELSLYMTGKYFVNTALTAGLFAAVLSKLKGELKVSFCAVCALAFIFGEIRLLGLFIFIYNPVLYLAYIICSFIAYLVPSLLDLRIGFKDSASLFELAKYGSKWGYVIALFAVLSLLMYFVSRLVFARFDFSSERYLPKQVRLLITALGGEENLEKLEGGILTVKNPNLIDILKIDCDIHQNAVSLYQDEIQLLKEYYYESS